MEQINAQIRAAGFREVEVPREEDRGKMEAAHVLSRTFSLDRYIRGPGDSFVNCILSFVASQLRLYPCPVVRFDNSRKTE